jgi:hypothetical protein
MTCPLCRPSTGPRAGRSCQSNQSKSATLTVTITATTNIMRSSDIDPISQDERPPRFRAAVIQGGDHADVVLRWSCFPVPMCCDHAPRDRRQPQHRAAGFRGCAKEHPRIGWVKSNCGPVPIWIEPPPDRPRAPCRRDCEFRVRERFLEGFAGSYESAAKHNFLATPDKTNPRKWRQAPSVLRAGRVCLGSKCF